MSSPAAAAAAASPSDRKAVDGKAEGGAAPTTPTAADSPSGGSLDGRLLMEFAQTSVFEIKNTKKSFLETNTLQMIGMPNASAGASDPREFVVLLMPKFQIVLDKKVPVLKVATRNYIFPMPDANYGVVLSALTPTDALDQFDVILSENSAFRKREPQLNQSPLADADDEEPSPVSAKDAKSAPRTPSPPVSPSPVMSVTVLPKQTPAAGQGSGAPQNVSIASAVAMPVAQPVAQSSDRVVVYAHSAAAHMESGSKSFKTSVISGATHLGRKIHNAGDYLKTRITPRAEPVVLSDKTKQRLSTAKYVSGAAVKVSKALVAGAMAAVKGISVHIGDALADTEVGKQIAAKGSERTEAAKAVALSAVGAIVEVYEGLETAALILLGDTAETTAVLLNHKYGTEVGAAAADGAAVVKDVASSAANMRKVGTKSLVAVTAVRSGGHLIASDEQKAINRGAAATTPAGIAAAAAQSAAQHVDPALGLQAAVTIVQLSAAAGAGAGAADANVAYPIALAKAAGAAK